MVKGRGMFSNRRLGFKIGMGFSSVLILLSVVLSVGIYSLHRAVDGISTYRNFARDSNLAGDLRANMLMLQMQVQSYLISKSDENLKSYEDYSSRVYILVE